MRKNLVLALATAGLAFVAGCGGVDANRTAPVHYGEVPKLSLWTVPCDDESYAVYNTKQKSDDQRCYTPPTPDGLEWVAPEFQVMNCEPDDELEAYVPNAKDPDTDEVIHVCYDFDDSHGHHKKSSTRMKKGKRVIVPSVFPTPKGVVTPSAASTAKPVSPSKSSSPKVVTPPRAESPAAPAPVKTAKTAKPRK